MDSVLMTTPSNGMKLRSRLRSAATTICTRSTKNRRAPRNFIKVHHASTIAHNNGGSSSNSSSSSNNSTNNTSINIRNFSNNINKQLNNNNTPRNINNLNETRRCIATSAHNNNGNEVLFCGKRGKNTREVYNAWCGRLGDVTRIPSDSVQALFNDMQLYPSKNQVFEMLQCARQCSRRNSSQYLTFGEFCVFAGELRRGNRRPNRTETQKAPKTLTQCEVFLGGSCNPTTWRADIAIPTLSKLGISYYNPQVSTWSPELMAAEHDAKESASVLFFVVDSQTRCVAGMLEVAHLVAKKRCLVLVVYPFTPGQSIMDEPLTSQEFVDLSEGQSTLLTLVKKQGITVHSNLATALQCTVNILRTNHDTSPDTLTAERKLTDKLMKLRETFDAVDGDGTGELTLPNVSRAYYQLTGSNLRISDLHSIMNMSSAGHTDPDLLRITFEQFCGIVAEFTTNNGTGCPQNTTAISDHDWVSPPLHRQPSTNNNTNYDYDHKTIASNYDIYLGGSCYKRTSWRQSTAIPLLKRYGVTYYNPSLHENGCNTYMNNGCDVLSSVISDKSRNLLNDMEVMNSSKVVMFVITNETRSITSMILAAHYIALRKNVVLCVQQLPLDDCQIGADLLTKQAIKDYNRARAYLGDLAKHENVPIYENIKEAVQCAINLCQTQQQQQQR